MCQGKIKPHRRWSQKTRQLQQRKSKAQHAAHLCHLRLELMSKKETGSLRHSSKLLYKIWRNKDEKSNPLNEEVNN